MTPEQNEYHKHEYILFNRQQWSSVSRSSKQQRALRLTKSNCVQIPMITIHIHYISLLYWIELISTAFNSAFGTPKGCIQWDEQSLWQKKMKKKSSDIDQCGSSFLLLLSNVECFCRNIPSFWVNLLCRKTHRSPRVRWRTLSSDWTGCDITTSGVRKTSDFSLEGASTLEDTKGLKNPRRFRFVWLLDEIKKIKIGFIFFKSVVFVSPFFSFIKSFPVVITWEITSSDQSSDRKWTPDSFTVNSCILDDHLAKWKWTTTVTQFYLRYD